MSTEKVLYEALLHAAAELPAEVGDLTLELAKRRPLRVDVAARVAAGQARRAVERRQLETNQPRRPIPRGIYPIGRLREPWPDGPADHIDRDFEQAVLDGAGFV